MVGFQAEQMHEKSDRKVCTFGKVYRKANNIDRMKKKTKAITSTGSRKSSNRHSEYHSRCCCPQLGPPSGFPAVSPVLPVT